MTTVLWTDAAIGETRQAIVRDGRAIGLSVWRWSDEGRRARWGETYAARVRAVDVRRRGVFLDLGLEQPGFVRLNADGGVQAAGASVRLSEGQAVSACVRRESARGKAPVMDIIALSPAMASRPGRTGRHESATEAEAAGPATADIRDALDAAFDAALSPRAPAPGGGVLIIEPTSALVAIDVDAGDRGGTGDAERFAADLNKDAAREAMRQLRLRNLGGLVAIDFVSMRRQSNRLAVSEALRAAAADDPWGVRLAPMSRFGVVELSRGQLCTPLLEVFCDAAGAITAETAALAALRQVEREAGLARGRPATLRAGAELAAWLEADHIAWRSALAARIGPRWSLVRDQALEGRGWRVEVEP